MVFERFAVAPRPARNDQCLRNEIEGIGGEGGVTVKIQFGHDCTLCLFPKALAMCEVRRRHYTNW